MVQNKALVLTDSSPQLAVLEFEHEQNIVIKVKPAKVCQYIPGSF